MPTASTCTPVTEKGRHVFEIFGYSELKNMGIGKPIRSGAFSIGGYEWAIVFCPNGYNWGHKNFMSVRLELLSKDLNEQLAAKSLDSEEGDKDVTFSVGGETFTARKKVLALRSPVFRAELYGPMSEARAKHLTIQDMQPSVFRALLHFIDTDSLPDGVDHHGGDSSSADCEMVWHLLEAADRYALDRLKVLCESILCKNLDAETVSTTLALASQHNCDKLRDICLQYVSSPNVMDAVVATQGYKNLKASCPSVVIEMFEEAMRLQNT